MKATSSTTTTITTTAAITPNEIQLKIGNANSLTNSSNQSSHSPSVTGELLDVKVEITPAPPTPMSDIQNSFSVESTSSLTICSDSSKSQSMSPNTKKFPEIEGGGFLNPMGNFNRMNPSPPGSASCRLFKKLEEMIDLSLPYNHYRCLSPSETNLTNTSLNERPHSVSPNARQLDSGKPGSSRLLRRQFSLDKDDMANQASRLCNLETISSLVDSSKLSNISTKAQYQQLVSSASLPASAVNLPTSSGNNFHKHQSASVAQDLEKIEEIGDNSNSSTNIASESGNDVNSFKNSNSYSILKTPASTTTTASISNSSNAERGDFSINVE
jgi:guanylate cyclase 2F